MFCPIMRWRKHHHPHITDKNTEEGVLEKLNNLPKLTNPMSDRIRTQNQGVV